MSRGVVYAGAAVLLVIAWAGPEAAPVPQGKKREGAGAPVIVAIVRHAEKEGEGQDPGLTAAGKLRADRLAAIFRKTKLDLLVASDLRRTQETLEPIARAKGIKVRAIKEPADVARVLGALRPGSTALVAHHSFSIRDVLEELGVPAAESRAIDLEAHDNLLIVACHPDLETKLLTLSY
jgi:phosphohistidine phosphatase SixA